MPNIARTAPKHRGSSFFTCALCQNTARFLTWFKILLCPPMRTQQAFQCPDHERTIHFIPFANASLLQVRVRQTALLKLDSQPVCAQARRTCHRDARGRRGPDDTMITKQTSDLELAAPMRIDKKMGAVTGFVAAIPAQINSPRTHHRVARLHETFPRGILSILLCSRDRNHRPNCFFAHSVLAASRISCQLANAELAEMKASHGASGIALKSSGAFTE